MDCLLKMRAGQYTIPSIIFEALADGDQLDSFALCEHVMMYRESNKWHLIKHVVDSTLTRLCKKGTLYKSKNSMTDENVQSTQSKFMYFTHLKE